MPRVYRTLTLEDYEVTKDYYRVIIGGKKYFVHRLVAEKYVPNPENKPQVNHIDGDKTNNRADNLEWVTNRENRNHAVVTGLQWSKLKLEDVRYIKQHLDTPTKELVDMFNVSRHCINKLKRGITFKNVE